MSTDNNLKYDVCIIGGGPSGLTAAIYTARAFLGTLVLCGNPPGGQLTTTSEVENFPGFTDGIDGLALIESMRAQAKKFSAKLLDENVQTISGDYESGFELKLFNGQVINSKTVIVATGASAKWLGIESEQRLRGKGVSACATCDGFFFRGKVVAVIGGGDAAMEEANFLTKFASKVYVLVRKSQKDLRASKIMQDRAIKSGKIEFVFNTEVTEVLGESSVTGLKVLNVVTNQVDEMNDVQGLFLAIGHTPNTTFLKDFVDLDEAGYVKVTNNTNTSKKGVFVSGDVSDHRYRQAITAAGLGCMAAIDVEKLIAEPK